MKKIIFVFLILLSTVIFYDFSSTESISKEQPVAEINATTAAADGLALIKPEDVPESVFVSESTMKFWENTNFRLAIYKHAWKLWAALTKSAKGTDPTVLVYQTWETPKDIIGQSPSKALAIGRSGRAPLEEPVQLKHHGTAQLKDDFKLIEAPKNADNPYVQVGYNPIAADFATDKKIFQKATIEQAFSRAKPGIPAEIEEFPSHSIITKPIYMILDPSKIDIDAKKGYYILKVWTGPDPDPKGYPPSQWPHQIYIDTTNNSQGDGSVADTGTDNPTPQTTYNLNDFIHYRMGPNDKVPGAYAVLVGLHIITKEETQRWVWQTFWWTADVKKIYAPATDRSLCAKPKRLKGAQAHYTVSAGYTFSNPNQKFSGGSSDKGKPLYVYNPYLEATFSMNNPSLKENIDSAGRVGRIINTTGVTTNCMSCHALASYDVSEPYKSEFYVADTYIDMLKDSHFKGRVKTDFLWTIPNNVK